MEMVNNPDYSQNKMEKHEFENFRRIYVFSEELILASKKKGFQLGKKMKM